MMPWAPASRLTHATSVGGSMVSEQTAVMVRPCHSPPSLVATMQTPPARRRMLCLNTSDEIGVSVVTPVALQTLRRRRRRARVLAEIAGQFELALQVGDGVEIDHGVVAGGVDVAEGAVDLRCPHRGRARRRRTGARSPGGSTRRRNRNPSASGCDPPPASACRSPSSASKRSHMSSSSRRAGGDFRGGFGDTLLHDRVLRP